MARAGLTQDHAVQAPWTCLFANDVEAAKATSYRANWGPAGTDQDRMTLGDVALLIPSDLPPSDAPGGRVSLAWASFPCQDLSLAGQGRGLAGQRSGAYWAFHRLLGLLARDGRAPEVVAIENVPGLISSRQGQDFAQLCVSLQDAGYRVGALVLDAAAFVPQSRRRVFVIAQARHLPLPLHLTSPGPDAALHPANLVAALRRLSPDQQKHTVWWTLPRPDVRQETLADLLLHSEAAAALSWHTPDQTARLIALMDDLHRDRLRAAQVRAASTAQVQVGALYRRTRQGVVRAEVRFDGLAGCLRTPSGGSSRQTLLLVDAGGGVRSRLLAAREAARLMGLPDDYHLPDNEVQAAHLLGDGVAIPVVAHLARHLLRPLTTQAG